MKSASMYNKMCRIVFSIADYSRIMRKQAVPAKFPGAHVALEISSNRLFLDAEAHILLEKTALREVSKVPLPPFPWTLKHAFRFKKMTYWEVPKAESTSFLDAACVSQPHRTSFSVQHQSF